MSSSAYTQFCVNGHLVNSVPYGSYEDDDPVICPYCGETRLADVIEWGNPDYPMCDAVPFEPLRFNNVKTQIPGAVDRNGSPIEAYCFFGIPIYDVSGLDFPEPVLIVVEVENSSP